MTCRKLTRLAALLLTIGGVPAMADDIRREAVHFAPGTSGSTINGRIKGYNAVQYSLGVKAGQKMSVQLDSGNASLYFNITAPGAARRSTTAPSMATARRSPSRPAAPM